jgi:hypothetical protein
MIVRWILPSPWAIVGRNRQYEHYSTGSRVHQAVDAC